MWLAELHRLEVKIVERVEHVLEMSLHPVQIDREVNVTVGWTRVESSHNLKVSVCVNP
jgi:hypothetical protein